MKILKKAILSLCRTFPVTHKRVGEVTDFEGKIEREEKIHTIRHDAKGMWEKRFVKIRAGLMYLDMREWADRPYNSEQRNLFQRTREDGIGLQKIEMEYSEETKCIIVQVDGKGVDPAIVAKNDGLSLEDFIEWFFHGKSCSFSGKIIHFTKFRY